jgi:hypothetical protein
MDRPLIFFAIAVAEAAAGDGASCREPLIFFAIAVADRPALLEQSFFLTPYMTYGSLLRDQEIYSA